MKTSERIRRYMETLIILDKEGRMRRLRFNPAQEMIWPLVGPRLDAGEPLALICLKARQEGVSTFIQALMYAYMHLFPAGEAITIAHDWDASESIFRMNKRFYEMSEFPKAVDPRRRVIEVPTDTGSLIWRVMTAGAKAKARGQTLRCLHLSEVAFWTNPDTMLGVLQTIPPPPVPTITVIESTANGKTGDGQLFYEEWRRAVEGHEIAGMPTFVPVFLPWFALPEYRFSQQAPLGELDEEERELRSRFGVTDDQLAWRRWYIVAKCRGDLNLFHQEYPAYPEQAFLSSGIPAFDPRAIARQRVHLLPPQRYDLDSEGRLIPHSKGPLRLWPQRDAQGALVMPPLPKHRYIIGADTCQGEGGNLGHVVPDGREDTRSWAAAEVFDVDTLEQVGEWHAPTPGYEMAAKLYHMATRLFNHPMIVIEVNYLGRAVQDRLKDQFRYTHLHPWKGAQDQIRKIPERLWGWETTIKTKGYLLDTAQDYLHTDKVTIRSEILLEQLEAFSRSDVRGGFDSTLADDCAIAAMMAWRSRMENYYPIASRPPAPDLVPLEEAGVRVVDDAEGAWAKHWRRVHTRPARWGAR